MDVLELLVYIVVVLAQLVAVLTLHTIGTNSDAYIILHS